MSYVQITTLICQTNYDHWLVWLDKLSVFKAITSVTQKYNKFKVLYFEQIEHNQQLHETQRQLHINIIKAEHKSSMHDLHCPTVEYFNTWSPSKCNLYNSEKTLWYYTWKIAMFNNYCALHFNHISLESHALAF